MNEPEKSSKILRTDTCRWCKKDIAQINPEQDNWVHMNTISKFCQVGGFFGWLFHDIQEAEPEHV